MKFILLFIFPFFLVSAMAHNGTLKGIVRDVKQHPLESATIQIGENFITSTDVLGKFSVELSPGEYKVVVTYVGFMSVTKQVTIKDNEVTSVSFMLDEAPIQLSDVIISGGEIDYVNRISQIDIALRPVQNSQEVLRQIPGLFIAQHAGGGKAEQIFLRGFDIDHGTDINLSVDGMPVNMVSHAHGQGYADLHFVIPELIESVDFNKGPYYSRYGDFTTAGYARFNTRDVLEESMVKLEGGQFGTFRGVAAVSLLPPPQSSDRQYAYMAAEFLNSDGYFESSQHFTRINLFGKYHRNFSDDASLTLSASSFSSNWDASGQIPDRAVESGLIGWFGAIDDTEGGETSRQNLNAMFTKRLENDALISQQVFFSHYDFNLVSNFTFFLEDPVNGDQITQSESRNIYGYNGQIEKSGQFGNPNFNFTGGLQIRYDDIDDIRLSHTRDRREILEDLAYGDTEQMNIGLFAEEEFRVSQKLMISVGARYDHFIFQYTNKLDSVYNRQGESAGIFSPKLRLDYSISNSVSLFLKGGTGFHSNDARVVIAQEAEDILPRAYGADLGAIIKPLPNMSLVTTLWWLDLDQEFVYVGDAGIVEPGGKTRRTGLDISLRYQVLPWLFLDSDVTLADPRALDTPESEDNIPLAVTFSSTGGLTVEHTSGFSGSLRYRWLGDRPANEDNTVIAEGYFLLDAVAKYRWNNIELRVSAQNVLDNKWKEAQFNTESRLQFEPEAVEEIHFTPGTPFFLQGGISLFF